MHEISHVSVKDEPRSTSRLSSALYILPLFYSRHKNLRACTRTEKLRDTGNQPLEAGN